MLAWLQTLLGGTESTVEEVIDIGVPITNLTAETRTHSGNTICDRSGRKAYPGELRLDTYNGQWVFPKYLDVQQREGMVYRSREVKGAKHIEQDNLFIVLDGYLKQSIGGLVLLDTGGRIRISTGNVTFD